MSEDREPFLERWSRLKQEKPAQEPAATPAVVKAKEESDAPLQPVSELNPDSDFTPFMNPKVDGATRSAALKKLFTDAHYNIPDPYEAYSGDWTAGEPIPMEMLKRLNHARKLLFDEPEKKTEAAVAAAAPTEGPQAGTAQAEIAHEDAKDGVGKQDA